MLRRKTLLLASTVFFVAAATIWYVEETREQAREQVREQTHWETSLAEIDKIHIATVRDMLSEQPQGAILEWENGEFTVVHLARDPNQSAGMRQDGREYTFPLSSDRIMHSIKRIYKSTDPGYAEASKKFSPP